MQERKETRRQFSPEFKLEAVRLMGERKAAGVSVAQVSRELGIRPEVLRTWKRKLEQADLPSGERAREHVRERHVRDVFPGNGKLTSQDEELRRVKRELATVRQERDFLKRAAAFFAKESR